MHAPARPHLLAGHLLLAILVMVGVAVGAASGPPAGAGSGGSGSVSVDLTGRCGADGNSWDAELEIRNPGSAAVTIGDLTVSGVPASAFAPVVKGASIAAGATLTGVATGISLGVAAVDVVYRIDRPSGGALSGSVRAGPPGSCGATTTTATTTTATTTTAGGTSTIPPGTTTNPPATSSGPTTSLGTLPQTGGPTSTSASGTTTKPPATTSGPQPTTKPPSQSSVPASVEPNPPESVTTNGPDSPDTSDSGTDPGDDRVQPASVRFQPEGSMEVGLEYLVQAQVFLEGSTPSGPVATFDPNTPTTIVQAFVQCVVRAKLEFDELNFRVADNSPVAINLCDGRPAGEWSWIVSPLRAGRFQLTLVLTYGDGAEFAEKKPGTITVEAGDPPVADSAARLATQSDAGGGSGAAPALLALSGSLALGAGGVVLYRKKARRKRRARALAGVARVSQPGERTLVFLSYSRDDLDVAERLEADLEAVGYETWRDVDDIAGGEAWRRSIAGALDRAVAVVLMVSPTSVTSTNVAREIALADDARTPIIPILIVGEPELEGSLKYTLAETQMIDLRGSAYEPGFERLHSAIEAIVDAAAPTAAPDAGGALPPPAFPPPEPP